MSMTDKPLSKFLEFETKEPKEEEFGISKYDVRKTPVGRKIAMLVCPICGLHRVLNKTGSRFLIKMKAKGLERKNIQVRLEEGLEISETSRAKKYNPYKHTGFDHVDIENVPFISIRVRCGEGKGFKELKSECIKLSDIPKQSPRDRKIFLKLVDELREQCTKILDYTKKIGL